MSRYSKEINNGKTTLVWGYDNPLSEYFLQAFDNEAKEDEDDTLFSISSYTTLKPHPKFPDRMTWSNGELLELINNEYPDELPAEHVTALACDLPF